MPHRFIPPLPTDGADSANDSASTTAAATAVGAPMIDPTHTLAIKRWTKEILRIDDDAVIHVSEVACIDAGCPLVETVVTVFTSTPANTPATAHENTPLTHAPAGTRRTWTFTRPRVAVTKMMLQQTLATPPR